MHYYPSPLFISAWIFALSKCFILSVFEIKYSRCWGPFGKGTKFVHCLNIVLSVLKFTASDYLLVSANLTSYNYKNILPQGTNVVEKLFQYFTVASTTWLTVMQYPCHKWPPICSTCPKHFPVLSSFMTYHRGGN